MILKINNFIAAFKSYTGVNHTVDNISITLSRHKTLGIIGESGSGKSKRWIPRRIFLIVPSGNITGNSSRRPRWGAWRAPGGNTTEAGGTASNLMVA